MIILHIRISENRLALSVFMRGWDQIIDLLITSFPFSTPTTMYPSKFWLTSILFSGWFTYFVKHESTPSLTKNTESEIFIFHFKIRIFFCKKKKHFRIFERHEHVLIRHDRAWSTLTVNSPPHHVTRNTIIHLPIFHLFIQKYYQTHT